VSARGWILGAVGLGALALGVLGAHARNDLPRALKAAVARGFGIELEAVSFQRAQIGAHGLVVDDLSAGPFFVRRARFRPAFRALFGGTSGELKLERVTLEDPPGLDGEVDRVEVDHAEIQLMSTQARVRAHGVVVYPAATALPRARVGELGVELLRSPKAGLSLRRVAFTALSAGPFADLGGGGRVEDGTLDLRAGAPGIQVSVRVAKAHAFDAVLRFEHAHVAWKDAVALGIPTADVTLDGRLSVQRRASPQALAVDADVRVESGSFTAPRISPVPIAASGLAFKVQGEAVRDAVDRETARLDGEVHLNDARITIAAALQRNDADEPSLSVTLGLPKSDCAKLLIALPPALRRALDGMALAGDISGHLDLELPLDTPSQLELDGNLDLGCRVLGEPPLADVTTLRTGSPTLPSAVDAHDAPRVVVLGPANPGFRHLEQIPREVIDTFVEAEDGRFWQHRGVDLAQLRRALAHDLEIGAPGRGGSTITQQVAKNLFLSGERTIGRKLEESVLAWRLESVLGKRRILELYLNLVELGPGVYGVQEGAQHWFHEDAPALDADQAARLAALLPAPRAGMDAAFDLRLKQLRGRLPPRLASPSPALQP
jgi:hypothetical protein